ncbi:Uu.00g089870.m01.CDS01 [Anthostomella pinea]|uniref:Uu.00g089870.m01.CDS01 n=1 Tax=Anthostomella pinea TaxID=933095 RepID=A0AAI8YK39_9PEZI|nr:Uu.00g089870.m01.CDS01 [Anthostomella pinea]
MSESIYSPANLSIAGIAQDDRYAQPNTDITSVAAVTGSSAAGRTAASTASKRQPQILRRVDELTDEPFAQGRSVVGTSKNYLVTSLLSDCFGIGVRGKYPDRSSAAKSDKPVLFGAHIYRPKRRREMNTFTDLLSAAVKDGFVAEEVIAVMANPESMREISVHHYEDQKEFNSFVLEELKKALGRSYAGPIEEETHRWQTSWSLSIYPDKILAEAGDIGVAYESDGTDEGWESDESD